MKYNVILFLDDIRNPYVGDYLMSIAPEYLDSDNKDTHKIAWVKNFDEFTSWLNRFGLPDFVSFDHDLGNGKSGKDAANFLVEYCMNNNLELPEFYSHSANPVGQRNIMELLKQFDQENNKT